MSSGPATGPVPASVGQAATEAEAELNGIDSLLRTVDNEQATVNGGLAADEGDPSK